MKALSTTLTDPVYIPKEKFSIYDKFWLRLMNDKRDLPFIYLLTKIHILVLPAAVILFTPLLSGWWWWALAVPYFYVSQLYFKGRFGLMFHCLCHRKMFKAPYQKPFMLILPGYFVRCLVMHRRGISVTIWVCTILKTICRKTPAAL